MDFLLTELSHILRTALSILTALTIFSTYRFLLFVAGYHIWRPFCGRLYGEDGEQLGFTVSIPVGVWAWVLELVAEFAESLSLNLGRQGVVMLRPLVEMGFVFCFLGVCGVGISLIAKGSRRSGDKGMRIG